MKDTTNRQIVRELLKQGLTSRQIVERMSCDSSHAYRLVNEERLRAGLKPVSVDRLARLEERVRQLEKVVAALSSMKRFSGQGINSPSVQDHQLPSQTSDSAPR